MKFIVQYEGAVADVSGAMFELHRRVAGEVGWSALDQATFWRLIRTKGREADLLPGARPVKIKEYWRRLDELAEADDVLDRFELSPGIVRTLKKLAQHGPCHLVTLGSNLDARHRQVVALGMSDESSTILALNADPRLRPGELRALAGDDPRTVVVGSSDVMIRAGGAAELVTAAISNGTCAVPRLNRAGTDLIYRNLSDFCDSLAGGAKDLVKAGMLPLPLG